MAPNNFSTFCMEKGPDLFADVFFPTNLPKEWDEIYRLKYVEMFEQTLQQMSVHSWGRWFAFRRCVFFFWDLNEESPHAKIPTLRKASGGFASSFRIIAPKNGTFVKVQDIVGAHDLKVEACQIPWQIAFSKIPSRSSWFRSDDSAVGFKMRESLAPPFNVCQGRSTQLPILGIDSSHL